MDLVDDEMLCWCRICLEDKAVIPIFKKENNIDYNDTLFKLNLCFGVVPDLPGYPRNICEVCYTLLDETVSFINKYKNSCKLLDEKIKEEPKFSHDHYSEPEIEIDFDQASDETTKLEKPNVSLDHYSEPEIEIDFDQVNKKTAKVEFDDFQYETPKYSVAKNEPIEAENIPTSKTNKSCVRKHRNVDNQIALSLLEGEFVFQEENWSLNTTDKLAGKILVENHRKVMKSNKTKGKKIDEKSVKRTRIRMKEKQPSSRQKAPLLCEECGKSFTDNHKYSRHKSNHLSEKPHKCTKCYKKFSWLENLKSHIKRVHNKKEYICSDCGKLFLGRDLFVAHYKYLHQKVKRKYKGYPCKLCGKNNISLKMALIHERSAHTGERPAVCTVCDACFYHEDYLKEHMRLHTGETPFKCPVCDKGFAQRGNMKSHMKHNHSLSQLSEQARNKIDQKYFKHMKP